MYCKQVNNAYSNKELRHRFIDTDISWLNFNREVLHLAKNPRFPLAERVNFMGIAALNLHDWFSTRFSGTAILSTLPKEFQEANNYGWLPGKLAHTLKQILIEGYHTTKAFYAEMAEIYIDLIKELEDQQIRIIGLTELAAAQNEFIDTLYFSKIKTIFTPERLKHHTPEVLAPRKVAFGANLGHHRIVVIPLPDGPRLISLPDNAAYHSFTLMDTLMQKHLPDILQEPSTNIQETCQVRVFRNELVKYQNSTTGEPLEAKLSIFESRLSQRSRADGVWLEAISTDQNSVLVEKISEKLRVPKPFCNIVSPLIDYSFLCTELYGKIPDPKIKFNFYKPQKQPTSNSIFQDIKNNDLMLHMPYQSYDPVIRFFKEAAIDPDVRSIKTTLYRTNNNSQIADALETAGYNKKQVDVLIEIKASFDENRNIEIARRLIKAGCNVFIRDDLKVHAKISIVTRREHKQDISYALMSTGNYNEKTAQRYSDIILMTTDKNPKASRMNDLNNYFDYIVNAQAKPAFVSNRIFVGNGSIEKRLHAELDQETQASKNNGTGLFIGLMNGLDDIDIGNKIYAAAKAGVINRLGIRGNCAIKPSENIQIRRILGEYLEHARIYIFGDLATPDGVRVYISSADLRTRNLKHREEFMYLVQDQASKAQLIEIVLHSLNELHPQEYFQAYYGKQKK